MGLGKDEQGCPTMRQFADFAAQFADFVVTLQMLRFMHVDIIDLTKVLDKNACLRDVAFGLKLLLLLIPDAQ